MHETSRRVREAIVRAHGEGQTYVEIAERLGVGEATVSRILRLHRETGDVERRPRGGGRVSPLRDVERELELLVKEAPDSTVAEMAAELARRTGVRTSRASVGRALKRLGYTRKKSRS